MSTPEEKTKRSPRIKAGDWKFSVGRIEENARMVTALPQGEIISQRIIANLERLTREVQYELTRLNGGRMEGDDNE